MVDLCQCQRVVCGTSGTTKTQFVKMMQGGVLEGVVNTINSVMGDNRLTR
jgi:hypothetical protein